MTQFNLPDFDDEEDPTPPGFRILFPGGDADITEITETPPKMILPLVRMRIIDQATDTNRKMSLLETFVREFDRRMVSKDRKGRIEAVQMLGAAMRGGDDEDEAMA